ncbi:MAG: hypothetical protein ACK484_06690, partial [Sphingobacteriales bacterium]
SPYIEQIGQDLLHQQLEPHLALARKGVKQGVLKPLPAELLNALMSNQSSACTSSSPRRECPKQNNKKPFWPSLICYVIW